MRVGRFKAPVGVVGQGGGWGTKQVGARLHASENRLLTFNDGSGWKKKIW